MARITQRDNGKWQAKIERVGWPGQSKTFRLKKDAEAWATAVEREMDRGAFINRDDAERTTFKAAANRYEKEILPSKRGAAQDSMRLSRLVETFGKYSLASISSAMLSTYRDERLKAVSPQTVVHELGMISRVFKASAMDWGIALPHGNPTVLVRKPTVANERTRRLLEHEEPLLLHALRECKSPWPHAAASLAIETAARQSELLSLKWTEIDLIKRTARLRGVGGRVTKSGDEFRDVPLSSRAVELLSSLPRTTKAKAPPKNQIKPALSSTDRVIPITQNALQLSFERAIARARQMHIHGRLSTVLEAEGMSTSDISMELRALIFKKRKPQERTIELLKNLDKEDKTLLDLHFHDLRHEATSRLADKLQMHELMKVTGHKTSRMMSRYYHPRAEDLAKKLS